MSLVDPWAVLAEDVEAVRFSVNVTEDGQVWLRCQVEWDGVDAGLEVAEMLSIAEVIGLIGMLQRALRRDG